MLGLSIFPISAASASTGEASAASDTALFTGDQLPLLLLWIAIGITAAIAAMIMLSVARRRARASVIGVTAEHLPADAAVPAA